MIAASVTNIEMFRCWRENEELDKGWILQRIISPEQTEQMKVGGAFHKAIEEAGAGEFRRLAAKGYSFDFDADIDIDLLPAREIPIKQAYGDLLVSGRVDGISGKVVTDHKTTAYFDADRFMESYQWRFYLDMTGADLFRWNVFVLRETDDPTVYWVADFHKLEQRRYPDLRRDCERLAADYAAFAKSNIVGQDHSLAGLLKQSIALVKAG